MAAPDFSDEIRELNLQFLILAQRMAQANLETAAVKLGIDEESLEWLLTVPPAKLVRLAQGAMLVPQFRISGELLRQLAGEGGRDEAAAQLHALILAHAPGRKKARIVGDDHGEAG
ncbi:MAG: flagellar transcriptional regulator FlhD [Hydrogenophilus sp.]|nr:flagellar transcriptional regulator FlhD [Hydrogenophilus sp.]